MKIANHCRLGLLGCGEALLLLQTTLIIGGLQLEAVSQEPVQTRNSTTVLIPKQTRQELEYPGEETRNALRNAAKNFEQAIQTDPRRADNYIGFADAKIMLWCFGFVPRDDVLPQVSAAASRAVELNDKLAAAHTTLGIAKLAEWDWAGAESELQLAVRLEPDQARSRHWYALYLAAMGRHQQALKESEQAVRLDPSPGTQTGLGAVLYFGRDWARMIDQMSATTQQNPEFAPGYDWLGMAYVQEQRFDESIETYQKAADLSGNLAEVLAGLGHAYAMAGKYKEARSVLEKLHELDKRWYVPPVQIAYVHVGLGEVEETIQLLERAYQERSWELVFLQVEPWFDEIRSEPRFTDLIKRMKFPTGHHVKPTSQ